MLKAIIILILLFGGIAFVLAGGFGETASEREGCDHDCVSCERLFKDCEGDIECELDLAEEEEMADD